MPEIVVTAACAPMQFLATGKRRRVDGQASRLFLRSRLWIICERPKMAFDAGDEQNVGEVEKAEMCSEFPSTPRKGFPPALRDFICNMKEEKFLDLPEFEANTTKCQRKRKQSDAAINSVQELAGSMDTLVVTDHPNSVQSLKSN
jgi:hypothetical protein